jgi:hypothetical protein
VSAAARDQGCQRHLRLVTGIVAVLGITFAEQVKVMLLPAHRDLDHLVHLVQGRRRRQMDAPPHRRVNLAQGDLDLVNGAHGGHRIGVIITGIGF